MPSYSAHPMPDMSTWSQAVRDQETDDMVEDMLIMLKGGRTLQHSRDAYLRLANRFNAGPDDLRVREEIITRAHYRATQRASGVDITA